MQPDGVASTTFDHSNGFARLLGASVRKQYLLYSGSAISGGGLVIWQREEQREEGLDKNAIVM